jgi:hypothetical protein
VTFLTPRGTPKKVNWEKDDNPRRGERKQMSKTYAISDEVKTLKMMGLSSGE